MEAKRERRRRDLQRMKAKAARIGRLNGAPGNWSKLYNHLAVCSRACCGNPRRSFWYSAEEQMTMQERRFLAIAIETTHKPQQGE